MKIKFLAICAIFLFVFSSCGNQQQSQQTTPENDTAQTQDTGEGTQEAQQPEDAAQQQTGGEAENPLKTDEYISDYSYAGTLNTIGSDYIEVTTEGEKIRYQIGERCRRDMDKLGITEGMRVIVNFDVIDGQKTVTQIEKVVSE